MRAGKNFSRVISAGLVIGLAGLSVALSGCAPEEATKAVEQADEAPNAYGNALNRAKAVAGTEQEHQSAGYINRQTGGALGDGSDPNNPGSRAPMGAPGTTGAPGQGVPQAAPGQMPPPATNGYTVPNGR